MAASISSPTGVLTVKGDLSMVGADADSSSSAVANMTLQPSPLPERATGADGTAADARNGAGAEGSVPAEGSAEAGAASLLQLRASHLDADRLSVRGVRQWALVHADDFDGADTAQHGWRADGAEAGAFVQLSEGAGGAFLGGHCATAGAPVGRTFALPEHSQLRVQARVHFIDDWPAGSVAFLQVDGAHAWLDTAHVDGKRHVDGKPSGLNLAGGPHPERRWGVPVDVSLRHVAPSAFVQFGSSLGGDPCDASYGVDDVHVWVR